MTKTLIITGASQGIGKATAQHFLQQGWNSINLSRHHCDIDGVHSITIDFLQENWQSIIREQLLPLVSMADQIALVHNAGLLYRDKVGDMEPVQLQRTLQLNVMVPSQLNNLLIPAMAKNSSIIYIGSTLSEKAVAGCASYITSKHAIAGLMKATCQDLAGQHIYTCCICPGITDTQMLRQRCDHQDEILEQLQAISTDGRLIEPTEIAEVIWFCANSPIINGSIIHANLGQKER